MSRRSSCIVLPFFAALAGCHNSGGVQTPARTSGALATAESEFQALHATKDRIGITSARGATADTDGTSIDELERRYAKLRAPLAAALQRIDSTTLGADDRHALAAMRSSLAGGLASDADDTESGDAANSPKPDCNYDPAQLARGDSAYVRLEKRMYACYTRAVQHVRFEGKTLDRLTALGMLAQMDDREQRHRLFLAIDTIWRSMNGDDRVRSPYRTFVKLSAAKWRADGSPVDAEARVLRIDPALVESWLVSVLEAWRASTPSEMIEPWDYHYQGGAASRALSARVPLDDLGTLTAHYFRDLGADLAALHVHYDLAPRAGKTPVAFTDFGARPHLVNGAWVPGEPWVFATYRVGGLDNLDELLHETGHAVHISAIHQRPAFLDWPDNDALTEGLGDIAALESYEPRWQMHYLGDSVSTALGLRARYSGIVMDIAWSLFEVRMHRAPDSDPNVVWADLTSRYLHIVPHPELSWWAMRGQLIDAPGYMANYAIGAIIIADIRARVKQQHGDFTTGDPTWYAYMTDHIYKYGLSRSSADVITNFLGRPISANAILADMRRMAGR
jgi:hypothetical protein